MAQSRLVVAVSPIAFRKPGVWVNEDPALYNRYLQEMARVISQLLQRDYFLVIVWSGLCDDERVVSEIMDRLDDASRQRTARQMHVPRIESWKDFVTALQDADLLVASRLHSTILGFVTQRPTVAISFDPKVDWVMEDLGQTSYLLQICDFRAEDVIEALDRIDARRDLVMNQIGSYQHRILPALAFQYDALAEFVRVGRR